MNSSHFEIMYIHIHMHRTYFSIMLHSDHVGFVLHHETTPCTVPITSERFKGRGRPGCQTQTQLRILKCSSHAPPLQCTRFSSREACLKTTLTLWIFLIWTSWKWCIWRAAAQAADRSSFLFPFSPPLFRFWHRIQGEQTGEGMK